MEKTKLNSKAFQQPGNSHLKLEPKKIKNLVPKQDKKVPYCQTQPIEEKDSLLNVESKQQQNVDHNKTSVFSIQSDSKLKTTPKYKNYNT